VSDEILLVMGGVLAGIVNTIAGSGTLFTLGIMAFLNIPLNLANITTRPGVFFQNITGITTLKRFGQFYTSDFRPEPIICTCLGACLGAVGALVIPGRSFDLIATVVMVTLLLNYLNPRHVIFMRFLKKMNPRIIHLMFFVAGLYGGFVQIGIGIVILTLLLNYMSYARANAFKLVIILIYTIPTTLYFIYKDAILWKPALLLAAGQIAGAFLAATFISKNKKAVIWAKWITVAMIIVTLIKVWVF